MYLRAPPSESHINTDTVRNYTVHRGGGPCAVLVLPPFYVSKKVWLMEWGGGNVTKACRAGNTLFTT